MELYDVGPPERDSLGAPDCLRGSFSPPSLIILNAGVYRGGRWGELEVGGRAVSGLLAG